MPVCRTTRRQCFSPGSRPPAGEALLEGRRGPRVDYPDGVPGGGSTRLSTTWPRSSSATCQHGAVTRPPSSRRRAATAPPAKLAAVTADGALWCLRLWHLAVKACRWAAVGWVSAARVLARRPKVEPGASAVSYVGGMRTVLAVLIALSAVEIVVLDLALQSWPAIRFPVLVLGVSGLLFMARLHRRPGRTPARGRSGRGTGPIRPAR